MSLKPLESALRSLTAPLASALVRHRAPFHPRSRGEILQAQSRHLRHLLGIVSRSRFGKGLRLASLLRWHGEDLLQAYREGIPSFDYGQLSPEFERIAQGQEDVLFPGRPRALAQTSGTTGSSGTGERWIPQNESLLGHHSLGGLASLSILLERAGPSLLDGRILFLGGSTDLRDNPVGIPTGDLSGIAISRVPWILEGLLEPHRELALEPDWNEKIARIARKLAHQPVSLVSGIPSWLVILFEEICKQAGVERLHQAWPNLRALVHGGVSIDPYLPLLREHLPPRCLLMEVYPASEAFLAVGSRPWLPQEGRPPDLQLLLNHGIFLEFLPEAETDPSLAVDARHLEEGAIYKVLVSTPGGLLRYPLGDLVEGRAPGLVRFAGRIRTRLSVFGEHVEGARLSEALASACQATGAVVREWHVAPVLPSPGSVKGRHEWWIEFAQAPDNPRLLESCLDDHLRRTVLDYDAHRHGDAQLLPPTVRAVAKGTFRRTLASLGKLGGQHKVPTAWPDRTWADHLQSHDQETDR